MAHLIASIPGNYRARLWSVRAALHLVPAFELPNVAAHIDRAETLLAGFEAGDRTLEDDLAHAVTDLRVRTHAARRLLELAA